MKAQQTKKTKRQIAQERQSNRIVLRAKDVELEIYNRNLKEKHVPKELRNIAELKEALRTAEKFQGIRPVHSTTKIDEEGDIGTREGNLDPNNWWIIKNPRSEYYYARNIYEPPTGCGHRYTFVAAYKWSEHLDLDGKLKTRWTLNSINLKGQREKKCCEVEGKENEKGVQGKGSTKTYLGVREQLVKILNPRIWDSPKGEL